MNIKSSIGMNVTPQRRKRKWSFT